VTGNDHSPRPRIRPGLCLDGFTLTSLLGRGGQGVVYEAMQDNPQRRVAIKLLAPGLEIADRAQLDRFVREGRAGGRVSHRGLVTVLAVGEAEGIPYIAQELVPGGRTLVDLIHEARESRQLPPDHYTTVASLFADVAEALHAIHEQGVVHRDVKPSNVLLTPEGHPKLADFGLCKLADEHTESHERSLMGTPYYMSPEQIRGTTACDRRSDVFSLGVTLYEALTFIRPFDADTHSQVLQRIMLTEPAEARKLRGNLPVDLQTLCMRALEKEPERRFQTAGELAEELRRFLNHVPIRTRPPGIVGRLRRWTRQHKVAAAAGLVGLVGATGIALALALLYEQQQQTQHATLERITAESQQLASEARLAREQRDHALAQAEIRDELMWIIGHLFGQLDATDATFERALDALAAAAGTGDATGVTAALPAGGSAGAGSRSVAPPDAGSRDAVARQVARWQQAYVDRGLGAEALIARLRDEARRLDDPDRRRTRLTAVGRVSAAYGVIGPAAQTLEQVVAMAREQLGNDDERTRAAIADLADVSHELGGAKLDLAESLLRELVASETDPVRRRALQSRLAMVLADRGQWDEAEALLTELLPGGSEPVHDVGGLRLLQTWAGMLVDREWLDEAESVLARAWDSFEAVPGAEEADLGLLHALQGRLLAKRAAAAGASGRVSERRALLDEAIERFGTAEDRLVRSGSRERVVLFEVRAGLGLALAQAGETDEAVAILEDAAATARRLYGERHPDTSLVRSNLALAYHEAGHGARADALLRDVVAWSDDGMRDVDEGTLHALYNLAARRILAFDAGGDPAELERAEAYARKLLEHTSPSHPRYARRQTMLADIEDRARALRAGDGRTR